ncbi:MAG: hypothetical protein IJN38_03665 [Clostridia bacterium]|nr:hypothetical protein [Clostridia bacterium]
MKNGFKKLLSVILCAVLLFTTASVAFAAEETRTVVDSGYCGAQGENLTWTLYSDGELVISGEGEMDWYYVWSDNKKAPWNDYFEDIYIVTIEEGVTGIGHYAFVSEYLTEYCKINLPKSLQFVEGSFFNSIEMTRVPGQHLAYCYAGSEEDWSKVKQKICNVKIKQSVSGTVCGIEYTGEQMLTIPELKYAKVYYNGEEPEAFCELVEDKELGYDFIVHYYSPEIRAEKILWYQVHNGKDKKVAQMNVGEYDVKEFLVTTTKSGQHYLRADVVDGDGNVIIASEEVLIAEVPEFGERIKLIFSDIKLLYAEVVYVLWLFVGLPIFGAVALPVLKILDLFGYEF